MRETQDANKVHLGGNYPFAQTKKKPHLVESHQNDPETISLNLLHQDVRLVATKGQHQCSSGCVTKIHDQKPFHRTIV